MSELLPMRPVIPLRECLPHAVGLWALAIYGVAGELATLAVSLPLGHAGWTVRVQVDALIALAGLAWVGLQLREWVVRCHPAKARRARYGASALQAAVVLFTIWNCCAEGRPGALLPVPVYIFTNTRMWYLWMLLRQPHPDALEAIDLLVAEQREELAQALRPADRPIEWDVPDGKHAPMVYFLRNGNRIKIGTTTHLRRRVRALALRDGNLALVLHGGAALERDLHQQFADLRIDNTEWFRSTKAMNAFIDTWVAEVRTATAARE